MDIELELEGLHAELQQLYVRKSTDAPRIKLLWSRIDQFEDYKTTTHNEARA